jgi:hypothetical protein
MKTYLDQIGSLDRQFREAIPDFEARLHDIIDAYYPFSKR